MEDKYRVLNDNYFDFKIFEDIFRVVNEQRHPEHDMFNSGLASADGAIRRLREEYYNAIKKSYDQEDIN
jgi:arginine deiminase